MWRPLSINAAVDDLAEWRGQYYPPNTAEPEWLTSWLPMAESAGNVRLVAMLERSSPDRLALGRFAADEPHGELVRPIELGLVELAQAWLEALRERYIAWDSDEGGWVQGPGSSRWPGLV